KTQLLDNLSVTWCEGDGIMVFSNTDLRGEKFSAASAGTIADFDPVDAVTDEFYTPPYTAFYPGTAVRETNQIYLDGTQHYTKTDGVLTFAPGENPMAATSTTTELPFKNLCGILKFQLYSASPCTVKSLRVTSLKSGEQLWGTGVVTFNGTNATLGALTGGTGSITLDCSNKDVELGTVDAPTEFMFVIPGGALSEGFTVTVTDADDKVWSKTTTANNTITKSTIKAMSKQSVSTHTPVSPNNVTLTAGCSGYIYNVGGTVTVPSGGTYTCEFGLVYSETDDTPTIEEGAQKVVAGIATFSGTKTFSADITGLTAGTTYHVRAYAMIDGAIYSTPMDISTPLTCSWTNGKSPHPFTVSDNGTPDNATDDIKVYFSQGNLQYIGSTGTWKFADHQFDFLGNNGQGSASTTVDRDLFGWGTSGWNNGNQFYQPYNTANFGPTMAEGFGYGPKSGTSYDLSLTGDYANADWGVYCAISNGGNQAGMWRTLTNAEWEYLIRTRTDGSGKLLYGEGKVGTCTPGLIILPDDWETYKPNLPFTPGVSSWSNVYSYSEWSQMEAAGAVFLPAAGYRNGTSVIGGSDMSNNSYWSSSCHESGDARCLTFSRGYVYPVDNYRRYSGYSVRLVSEN
ncbi:MAG: hypothetical protein MJZ97_12705, partial [Bacteroidales bacterium]|nr:hypothetical protein [Bacteroidales bacterium]